MSLETKAHFPYKPSQNGFTLIEFAIVIMIIGLLLAPAISIYDRFTMEKKIEHTERSLMNTSDAVNAFLDSFGRYPCPADMDAEPGDTVYGYENCTPSTYGMPSVSVEISNRVPALANPRILVGSIPFRTLNLEEEDFMDGYGTRLTYVVTEALTDLDTYSSNEGGISIINDPAAVDPDFASAISPPNTGSYMVISHGRNNSGGINRDGNIIGNCTDGSAAEQINCDYQQVTNNPIFLSTHQLSDYDDISIYYTGQAVTPWVYSGTDPRDLRLRRGDTVVVGETGMTTAPTGDFTADNLHIRQLGSDTSADGVLRATSTASDEGTITVVGLCDPGSAANCMYPSYISGGFPDPANLIASLPANTAGESTDSYYIVDPSDPIDSNTEIIMTQGSPGSTGGMACAGKAVMVGIKNNRPVCSDQVQFNCPTSPEQQILKGIDANMNIVCASEPPQPCLTETVTDGICGGTVTLPAGAAAGSLQAFYAGECYIIDELDTGMLNSLLIPGNIGASQTAIQNYLNDLNNDPASRTRIACDQASNRQSNSALVREVYECDNGVWPTTPTYTRERGNYRSNFPGLTDDSAPAEGIDHGGHQDYNPATPMSVPNNGNHDCWCREQYRVARRNECSVSGQRLEIDRMRCPQTGTSYSNNVWNSGDAFCTCTATTFQRLRESCTSYYGAPSGSMTGDVFETVNRTCSPPTETPTGAVDTSQCRCPNRSDQVPDPSPDACPVGTGNSFGFEGENYTDVSRAQHRRWVCPGPNGKGGTVSSLGEHGRWQTTSRTASCACDGSATGEIRRDCSTANPAAGGSIWYETVKDCGSDTFVETGNVSRDACYTCEWKVPGGSGTPPMESFRNGVPLGDCNCNTDTGTNRCAEPAGGGMWYNYSNCRCQPK